MSLGEGEVYDFESGKVVKSSYTEKYIAATLTRLIAKPTCYDFLRYGETETFKKPPLGIQPIRGGIVLECRPLSNKPQCTHAF